MIHSPPSTALMSGAVKAQMRQGGPDFRKKIIKMMLRDVSELCPDANAVTRPSPSNHDRNR